MKNLSAKLKLTLLNSLLLTTMSIVILALLLSFSETIVESTSKTQVMKIVSDNANNLEYDDRTLDLDEIDFFKNSVYTLLFTETEELVYGNIPADYRNNIPFKDKELTEITLNGTLYYIYDILSPVEDHKDLMWVRGIIPVDEVSATTNTILKIALISLPFFVVLGTIGCYFIVKMTFKPIDKIIETAKNISTSENLSLRINLKNSSEEINNLATTFDNMLNRLEGAFEAEKQFSQNVSHELRTPTAVILAQCEFALSNIALEEDKEEALVVINKQGKKMSKLISELLNLNRLAQGIEKVEFINLNLSELVTIVCEERNMMPEKNIKTNMNIMPNIFIEGNHSMLIRLVANLLNNAYSYGKEDGFVNVTLTKNNDNIVLSIEDNGIGIEEEHIKKIWNRFYQVDTARTSDKNNNMGLGLSMVKEIVKIHNAKISVSSEIHKGSIFTVEF